MIAPRMPSVVFTRFAGTAALVVAVLGLAYSLTFVIALGDVGDWATYVKSLCLLTGGLLSLAVLIAVYEQLRDVDASFALLALVLGLAGGLGSASHGAYDLALVARPEDVLDTGLHHLDPRGFLTFAVSGLSFLLVGWLALRSARFPERLGQLALLAGGLLILVWLGRLSIFDPENPILLLAAALAGFVVSPALYVWLGLLLRRKADAALR
jgi:hypothetical protein